ncbi:MAG: GntR family transcriptional regulator [Deltaproteobacteria bacterium]
MDIQISRESEVPLRRQLAEQIVLLIATAKLKPGQELPSVRELGRRLKIHHNTVSQAYQDLVKRNWLVRRRGAHLVVRSPQTTARAARPEDLDDLINPVIELARERGYSLQALRERVRARLLAQPPDHVLAVEQEEGLRRLLSEEIGAVLRCPVEDCSRDELTSQPGLAIGAMVVTPQYALSDVKPLLPKARPPIAVTFCPADEHVERIRSLRQPSVIAVVSISQAFLTAARSLLAPALGRVHTLAEHLLPLENPRILKAADLVFCDSLALKTVKAPAPVHYKLLAPESVEYLSNAIKFGT